MSVQYPGITITPNLGLSLVGMDAVVAENFAALDAVAVAQINNQTASYQLALSDASGYVRMNVSTANNLTVAPDSTVNFVIGTVITVRQVGAGQTTVVAGVGVTISSPSTLALRAQNSTVQLIKVAANTWDLAGDVQ